MPGRGAEYCPEGEYFHGGHCCLFCPAGTFVAQHCSAPHTRGRCKPCTEGEDYTAHENGLEECLSCRQCKDDQITLRPCTLTSDTECQCKQGYFCPAEGCEICQRCSTMCPEGKEIVQNCNATVDLSCGSPDQGSSAPVYIFVIILVCVIVGLLFFVTKKLRREKAASTGKDAEKGLDLEDNTESLILPEAETLGNNTVSLEGENPGSPEGQVQTTVNLEVKNALEEEKVAMLPEQGTVLRGSWRHRMERCWKRVTKPPLPAKTGPNPAFHQNTLANGPRGQMPANHRVRDSQCQIKVKDLSQKELRESFETVINEVPPKKWKWLMRTHLQENVIIKIIHDFPNDREEQCYQMLLTWKNTLGEKQTIIKLLEELKSLDIRAYENVLNSLKSNNIIIC
ncbi:tumor necrosis factor receptor superfamily member 6 isoform X2 [Calypte anna]|nr:tumor necrosis factor receptor superfamily member 6 isoform X2 [Calypte anna]